MQPITIDNLDYDKKIDLQKGNEKSHEIKKIKIENRTWYCKKIVEDNHQGKEAKDIVEGELIAQELLRLFLPHQPETKIGLDSKKNQYILSAEIENFSKFTHAHIEKIDDGELKHFGELLIYAMLIEEVDLKPGNIGIDRNNRVIKIDGDWCFASTTKRDKKTDFGAKKNETIEKLPYPPYKAFHWLNIYKQGVLAYDSTCLRTSLLSTSDNFRGEVNKALLKVCLLPDGYIEAFISAYTKEKEPYIKIIKEHQSELYQCALNNISFYDYIKTKQAENDRDEFLSNLKNFSLLNDKDTELTNESVKKNFYILKDRVIGYPTDRDKTKVSLLERNQDLKIKYLKLLVRELEELLEHVELKKIDPHDDLISDYVHKKKDEIRKEIEQQLNSISTDRLDIKNLSDIKKDVTAHFNSLYSNELKRVLEIAESLKKQASLFTVGNKQKSELIINALKKMPLLQRGSIISSEELNEVQRILATPSSSVKLNLFVKPNAPWVTEQFKNLKKEFRKPVNDDKNVTKKKL